MIQILKMNPGIKRGRRFLIKQAREMPTVLWAALIILFCIGPIPRIRNYVEYICTPPKEWVRQETVKKHEFVKSAQGLFMIDKNRERFIQQLLTYGISQKDAFVMMNSVTEFQDKTKNKIASSAYAEARRNNLFARLFGAPVLSLDGFFPNEERTTTRNGVIILDLPNSDSVVDASSYRNLLKKMKDNKNLKLTAAEERCLDNVRKARSERAELRERARNMVDPSIPRYLFCGGNQELDLYLRYFVSNPVNTFSLNILEGLKFFDFVPTQPKVEIELLDDEEDALESRPASTWIVPRGEDLRGPRQSFAEANLGLKAKKDAARFREEMAKRDVIQSQLHADAISAQAELAAKKVSEAQLEKGKRLVQEELEKTRIREKRLKEQVEGLQEELAQKNLADSLPNVPETRLDNFPRVPTSKGPSAPTPPFMACLSLGLRGGASEDAPGNPYEIHTSDEEDDHVLQSVTPAITVGTFFASPGGWSLAFLFWVFNVAKFKKPGSGLKEAIRINSLVDRVRTEYLQRRITYVEAYDRLFIDCYFSDRQIQAILESEDLTSRSALSPPPPPPKTKPELNQLGFVISGFIGFSILIWILQVLSTPQS